MEAVLEIREAQRHVDAGREAGRRRAGLMPDGLAVQLMSLPRGASEQEPDLELEVEGEPDLELEAEGEPDIELEAEREPYLELREGEMHPP